MALQIHEKQEKTKEIEEKMKEEQRKEEERKQMELEQKKCLEKKVLHFGDPIEDLPLGESGIPTILEKLFFYVFEKGNFNILNQPNKKHKHREKLS